jgi:hypothetical protein
VLNQYNSTGFQVGVPEAETNRYGGTATGMSDSQTNLEYRGFSYSSWTSWTALACAGDFANSGTNNWNGEQATPNSYSTYKDTSDHCPLP